MKITGRTKVIGIFADPVEHTLSPAMHNAAFEALGVDAVYLPFHVRPDGLEKAVKSIRALDMPGMNITIPHKEKVLRFLDGLDRTAEAIGAVNTIVNRGGSLWGYNTDGAGYMKSLEEDAGLGLKGRHVLVIGAGGAARAILYAVLRARPASVTIANRTVRRARALAADLRGYFPKAEIMAVSLEKPALRPSAASAGLIVNTTSIGMMGRGGLDLPFEVIPKKAVVSDIVYRPLKTGLLKKAASFGLKTHGGLGMLVHQGAIGFKLWTGKDAPADIMRKAALKALKQG